VPEQLKLGSTVLAIVLAAACAQEPVSPAEQTLRLVQRWVQGQYNNVAQAEADMASDLPPELMHRPMHQLFVPVEAPLLGGYIVYQQSSLDGSENPAMIFRHGLMQYLPDLQSGKLLQRELYWKDAEPWKNLHQHPQRLAELKTLTLDDFTWDAGCDFYLSASADGSMISGRVVERACVLFNQGLQQNMYADDAVEITATEYAFHGRFVDDEGNVLWGTGSDELNRMGRQ
jgi:hypothetical protein